MPGFAIKATTPRRQCAGRKVEGSGPTYHRQSPVRSLPPRPVRHRCSRRPPVLKQSRSPLPGTARVRWDEAAEPQLGCHSKRWPIRRTVSSSGVRRRLNSWRFPLERCPARGVRECRCGIRHANELPCRNRLPPIPISRRRCCREHTSWAIAGFADEIDGDVLFAEEPAVFFAHPVHAFAGCFHFVATTDALCEIIEGLLHLDFHVFGDTG